MRRAAMNHIQAGLVASLLAPVAVDAVEFPRPSPKASVTQTVGLTDVTITYGRPRVKGRAIWGELVPYDQVWRTGANEATTITIGEASTIEGRPLPAGTYGLYTIPSREEWTLIFNRGAQRWGAFEYRQEEDVLRVKVKPQSADFHESMTFVFSDVNTESARVDLYWERIRVSFVVKMDVIARTLAAAREQIAAAPTDDWLLLSRAATFCLENDVNLTEAAAWMDRALAVRTNYYTLFGKACFLALNGRRSEAADYARKAIAAGRDAVPKVDYKPAANLLDDLLRNGVRR